MFLNALFLLSGLGVILGCIAVVSTKNLMHACLYLLLTLFSVAGLYVTMNADFLAATQLVVYAGGVVILMLFAIMLTGGISAPLNKLGVEKIPGMGNMKTYFFAFITAIVVIGTCFQVIINLYRDASQLEANTFESTVHQIGELLITDHVLAFEISSILLLGALIGAAIIARPRSLSDESGSEGN
ncbi:MAG: NADH-quinone oxidoreductase subunit J [Bacteriovoracaceae bacterium]